MFHSVIIGMLLSKLYYWITVTVRADNGGPALDAASSAARRRVQGVVLLGYGTWI